MKKNIIILVALIVLCAMPVLAKPMVAVTNPLIDNVFMLPELNDQELIKIEGDGYIDPLSDNTNDLIVNDEIGPDEFWADYNTGNHMCYVHWNGKTYVMTNSEFKQFLQWAFD